MPTRFFGKTWISWAQFMIFGAMGIFSVPLGILFWTGALRDADNQLRPQAGPPMVIIGSVMLLVSVMAFTNILAFRRPLLALYREGIEVNMVGTSFMGYGRAVKLVLLLWAILSLRGFRTQIIRAPWESFQGVDIQGLPALRRLILRASFFRLGTNTSILYQAVIFQDAAFIDRLDAIAQTVHHAFADPQSREQLPSWSDQ